MEIEKRNVQYLNRKKLIKVDKYNNQIDDEILIRLEDDEGTIYEEGTKIDIDLLEKINWKDNDSLRFKPLTSDKEYPKIEGNETQIYTKSNGEVWVIPNGDRENSFQLGAKTEEVKQLNNELYETISLSNSDDKGYVIPLVDLTNNEETKYANNFCAGKLYVKRQNIMDEFLDMVDIFAGKNSDKNTPIFTMKNIGAKMRPCTFNYNGRKYMGIQFENIRSGYQFLYFIGKYNSIEKLEAITYKYLDSIWNLEINNSLNIIEYNSDSSYTNRLKAYFYQDVVSKRFIENGISLEEKYTKITDTFGPGKVISESTNLNNLLTKGVYTSPHTSVCRTLVNLPGDALIGELYLEVKEINDAYKIQELSTFFGATQMKHQRYYASGIFSNWQRVF